MKEIEMFIAGGLASSIFGLLLKFIANKFFKKTSKKQCPKCGTINVKYLGLEKIEPMKKMGKVPIKYYPFECNKCHWLFNFYGKL